MPTGHLTGTACGLISSLSGHDKGASFLDLATLSIMRGDDSLVRGRNEAPSPTVGYAQADCMLLLPGVVDTFSSFCTICSSDAQPTSTAASRGEPIRRFFSTANWLTSAARRDGLRRATERAITLAALLLILRIHGGHGARAITAAASRKAQMD